MVGAAVVERSSRLTRRSFLVRTAVAAGGLVVLGDVRGAAASARWPNAAAYESDVALSWFDLVLDLLRTTPGFSPPVASRAIGYAGVALHEAVAPGLPGRSPLAGRLNGLTAPAAATDAAYHNYNEMIADINSVVAAHPTIVRRVSGGIGNSYEGREMPLQAEAAEPLGKLRHGLQSTARSARPAAFARTAARGRLDRAGGAEAECPGHADPARRRRQERCAGEGVRYRA